MPAIYPKALGTIRFEIEISLLRSREKLQKRVKDKQQVVYHFCLSYFGSILYRLN